MTLVGPTVELHGLARTAHALRAGQQAEGAQVQVVHAGLAVAPAHFANEGLEAGVVQARHHDRALGILEELAVFLRDRCALGTADAEHQQARALAAEGLAYALAFLLAERGADQQDAPFAECTLGEQGQGLAHGQVGAMAGLGHDRGLERFEQIAAGLQVIGQRYQGVGTAGKYDNRCLRVAAPLQQVEQLAPGLFQAIGRDVAGEHFRCQLQQNDQGVSGFLGRLLHALPTGPEQGEQGQQPGQAQGNPGQLAVVTATATEQYGVKGFGQDHLPAAGTFLSMPELPEQPTEYGQQ
ncbi:hypothetical protein D3C80_1092790 [compost metagenome]